MDTKVVIPYTETISHKVVIADLSTSSVRIVTIPFPYYGDQYDARDIAEIHDTFCKIYIKNVLGLDPLWVNYTIFDDEDEVEVFVEKNEEPSIIVE